MLFVKYDVSFKRQEKLSTNLTYERSYDKNRKSRVDFFKKILIFGSTYSAEVGPINFFSVSS